MLTLHAVSMQFALKVGDITSAGTALHRCVLAGAKPGAAAAPPEEVRC